jgi:CheY-like chemotaxis protein/HPt (histidine-containing phosphotransfer) domain-containing protein
VLDISARQGPSGHILLAEDNALNQRVGTAMLETLGYHVDVAADGAEAVKAATLTPYRAILMDCQIPVMNGYQATGEIRRLQGASIHTPIIAVTASDSESDRQRCLAAGMDDYLTKPLSLKTLADVLSRWAPNGSGTAIHVAPEVGPSATCVGTVGVADPGQVLDAQVVGRLERLGKTAGRDLMGQLAILFLADADASIVVLREALAGNDSAAVNRSAHALSGASANLGATELARVCATLATGTATGNPPDGGAQLEVVEAELERVRSALGSRRPTP